MKTNKRTAHNLKHFKYLLAVASFGGTVALWSLFANQDEAAAAGLSNASGQNTSQLNTALPTLVPLDTSGIGGAAADQPAAPLQLRSVSAPPVSAAQTGSPLIVRTNRGGGGAVTTTHSSR